MSYFSQLQINDGNYMGKTVEITPMNALRVASTTRLVGTTFTGSTLDTNFWDTTGTTNGGIINQSSGEIILSTDGSANGTAIVQSVRKARYTGASANALRVQIQTTSGIVNNTRRWGAFDGVDGAYFQIADSTFSVVTRKNNSENVINSGSFNGSVSSYVLDTSAHTYEIYWTNKTVYFAIDDVMIHKVTASSATWTQTVTLPVRLDNINSNGSTTLVELKARVATISRLGNLLTQPTSKFNSGQTAGLVLKYGAGNLHGIVISAVGNSSSIILYDNTAASGTTLWASGSLSSQTNPTYLDFKGIPFSNGLTLVVGTANSNVLVMYE